MSSLIQTADRQGRVSLPASFANATVIIEQVSDTEVRICKVQVIPEDEFRVREEIATPLSDRDRDIFLSLLDDPPAPNDNLKEAFKKHKRHE